MAGWTSHGQLQTALSDGCRLAPGHPAASCARLVLPGGQNENGAVEVQNLVVPEFRLPEDRCNEDQATELRHEGTLGETQAMGAYTLPAVTIPNAPTIWHFGLPVTDRMENNNAS